MRYDNHGRPLSDDGHWVWDGAQWVPAAAGDAVAPAAGGATRDPWNAAGAGAGMARPVSPTGGGAGQNLYPGPYRYGGPDRYGGPSSYPGGLQSPAGQDLGGGTYPLPGRTPARKAPVAVLVGVVAVVLLVGGGVAAFLLTRGGSSSPGPTVSRTPGLSSSGPAATDSGTLAAGRYFGVTSQGEQITFEVTPDSQVGTINFTERVTCSKSGSVLVPFRGLPTTRGPLSSDGQFDIMVTLPEQKFRMEASLAAGRFAGALRHTFDADASGNLTLGTRAQTCDSDQVTFTASR